MIPTRQPARPLKSLLREDIVSTKLHLGRLSTLTFLASGKLVGFRVVFSEV